jgi:two-component system chemotaxis sensor kinase CheA
LSRRRDGLLRLGSLGTKVAIATCLVAVVSATSLFFVLTSRERSNLIAYKTNAATMVEQLLVTELAAALDFGDADDVRQQLDRLRADPDIAGAAVWTRGSAAPLAGWSAPTAPSPAAPVAGGRDGVRVTPDWLLATKTVVNRRGEPLAQLELTFTLAPENAAYSAARRRLLLMTIGVSVLSSGLLLLLARLYMIGPLSRLAEAVRAFGDGSRTVRVDVVSDDEIGDLTRAFNVMGDAVASRQEQVVARNRDMRLVLDHVEQGLLSVDPKGIIASEYSKVLVEWLDAPAPGETLWGYVGKADAQVGEWLAMGWEAVAEAAIPLDFALAQMPKAFSKGERHLRLEYTPIQQDGRLSRLLVVLSDVSGQIAREKADAAQRELVAAFELFARDRSGFADFFAEAEMLVRSIVADSYLSLELKRKIHTLKGTSAMFGLSTVADVCHGLEQEIADTEDAPSLEQRDALAVAWHDVKQRLATLLEEARSQRIQVEPVEHEALLAALRHGAPRSRIADELAAWRFEPIARRLELVARQAREIAERLGKSDVRIVMEHNDVRLDPHAWAPLWGALVHVVRNSIDHGIPEARLDDSPATRASSQPPPPTITLRAVLTGGEFVVEVADNGRGIDWSAVAERGRAIGAPCSTEEQLEELLFRGGLSTKLTVTQLSGRGIGLDAARAACAQLGGRVRVRSRNGNGTTVEFRFPAHTAGDGRGSAAPTVWQADLSGLEALSDPPRAPASSN